MFNVTPSEMIGMLVAAVALVSLSIWAQTFRKTQRDIIGHRNTFFAVSGVFLVISVGSLLFKGFNLGMDFTGGTIMEVGFVQNQDKVTPETVRDAIMQYSKDNNKGFLQPQVQVEEKALGTAATHDYTKVIIRLGHENHSNVTTEEVQGIADSLESKVGKLYRQTRKSLDESGAPAPSDSPSAAAPVGSVPSTAPASAAPVTASPSNVPAPTSASPTVAVPTETAAPSATPDNASPTPATAPDNAAPSPATSPTEQPSPATRGGAGKTGGHILVAQAPTSPAPSAVPSATPSAAPATKTGTEATTTILSRETIDPIIGRELWINSIMALGVALVLQMLYITFRFGNQIRYGVAADVALVHDVVIMAGLYSLAGRQVDSPFLAALLTVIGYSVMDSIVVFDRIRENVRHSRKGSYEEICNASVNQTMSRSVNTTMTVLLTLFALYFFGGDTLRNFAFALLVGITCGAYSSIFIATPVVVMLDKWGKSREEDRVRERRAAQAAKEMSSSAAGAGASVTPLRPSASGAEQQIKRRSTDASPLDEDYPDVEDMAANVSNGRRVPERPKKRKRRRMPLMDDAQLIAQKLDPALQEMMDGQTSATLPVIIQTVDGLQEEDRRLVTSVGGRVKDDLYIIQAFSADLPVEAVHTVLRSPRVLKIHNDAKLKAF